jgi:transcriptional regulator with XRE-family HTH domain
MKDRISFVITESGLKQKDFASALNVSSGLISQMRSGTTTPSDRTIADICRIFNVNEIWLRTGVGEPFIQLTREDEIAAVLGSAIAGGSSSRDRLIRALARLPDDAFPIIEAAILAAAEELKKDQ